MNVTDHRVMTTRCLRRSRRDPEAFFTALALPVLLMLMFGYVFGGAMRSSGHYVDYVVPGLIVLCAGFGAGTTAVAVASDIGNGIVDRFRSLPMARSAFLVGHVIASVVRNLVATALVIGVGLAVGWRPASSPSHWAAALGMIVLVVLAMSSLAALVGLVAGGPEAASSFTIVLGFAPYVSSAFVPVATMPRALRAVARHQPFTPIVDTMRSLWAPDGTGGSTGHDAALAVAYVLGVLGVTGYLAVRRFHRGARA